MQPQRAWHLTKRANCRRSRSCGTRERETKTAVSRFCRHGCDLTRSTLVPRALNRSDPLSPSPCKQDPDDGLQIKNFLRKEVIQPQVPLRLPCYDFTPVTDHSLVSSLPKVRIPTSGATNSHGVTGGVYKARERIHRSVLISDY